METTTIKAKKPTKTTKRPYKKKPLVSKRDVKKAISNTIRQIWATCIGGIAPIISFDVAHHQAKNNQWLWCIVAGLLLYSAPTVNDYLTKYIDNKLKTWGFVLAIETAMTFTEGWTAYAALAMMVSINALVLGKTLQKEREVEPWNM